MAIRAVVDTNVVLSGFLSHKGNPSRIIDAWARKAFVPIVSLPLKKEYLAVLKYDRIQRHLGSKLKETFKTLKSLLKMTQKIDQKVKILYKKLDLKLITIPGINFKTAASIIAEIGTDVTRFQHKKSGATALVAFAGLDPKTSQSGNVDAPRRMSKRGSPYLRKAIFNAAFVAKTVDPMFKKIYEKQKARGKHHFSAMGNVCTKMCHVFYSVMKNSKDYEPVLN